MLMCKFLLLFAKFVVLMFRTSAWELHMPF
jgi:hypothetical protein